MITKEAVINWLNEEIKSLKHSPHPLIRAKFSEAIRIRQKLCEKDAQKEKLKSDICDNYCKYTNAYRGYEDLLQEKCNQCPMNDL